MFFRQEKSTVIQASERRAGSRLFIGLATACSLLLASCSTSEVTSSDFVDDIKPADVLYNQALANMDAGDMKEAADRLAELDQQHPYSNFTRVVAISCLDLYLLGFVLRILSKICAPVLPRTG